MHTAALSYVHHELRTPINAILGYSEMLLEDVHASPAVHAKLRGRFEFTSRGVLDIGGKGQMRTWRLSGAAPALAGG